MEVTVFSDTIVNITLESSAQSFSINKTTTFKLSYPLQCDGGTRWELSWRGAGLHSFCLRPRKTDFKLHARHSRSVKHQCQFSWVVHSLKPEQSEKYSWNFSFRQPSSAEHINKGTSMFTTLSDINNNGMAHASLPWTNNLPEWSRTERLQFRECQRSNSNIQCFYL